MASSADVCLGAERSTIHSKIRNLGNGIPIKRLTKGMSETGLRNGFFLPDFFSGVPLRD